VGLIYSFLEGSSPGGAGFVSESELYLFLNLAFAEAEDFQTMVVVRVQGPPIAPTCAASNGRIPRRPGRPTCQRNLRAHCNVLVECPTRAERDARGVLEGIWSEVTRVGD
jgi:hypothetical protein